MEAKRLEGLREVERHMLEMGATCTGCAIGLYERDGDGHIAAIHTPGQAEAYCLKLQSLPRGRDRCEKYHERRAREAFTNERTEVALCDSGVYNQVLPISVGNRPRAVLVYGQMLPADPASRQAAQERHLAAIREVWPTPRDEMELRDAYRRIKTWSDGELAEKSARLMQLHKWLYGIWEEELRLDQYTFTLLHDLIIWLQPLVTHGEMIRERVLTITDDPVLREETDLMCRAVDALEVQLQNVRGYTTEFQLKTVDVGELIKQAVRLYEPHAQVRGIVFRLNLQQPADVWASEHHLRHALHNLVHNSVKYSHDGTVVREKFIEIAGYSRGASYVLEIKNLGVGILPEEFQRVLEPGYRGQLGKYEYRSGSGMGLTIANEIIERHHGRLELASWRVGSGSAYLTTATVALPRFRPV